MQKEAKTGESGERRLQSKSGETLSFSKMQCRCILNNLQNCVHALAIRRFRVFLRSDKTTHGSKRQETLQNDENNSES